MGQRANLVIIKDGEWRLYYDHWCANRLDVELFWGPDLALGYVRQLKSVDDSYWMDEIWCEGAALLDYDHQFLLWFGGEYTMFDFYWRKVCLDLMRENWKNWSIEWAHGGIFDVAEYLGLDTSRFQHEISVWEDAHFAMNEKYPEDNDKLIAVEDADGILVGCASADQEEALLVGPRVLDSVLKLPLSTSFQWPHNERPQGGVYFNLSCQELSFWFSEPDGMLEARVADAWPGWKINGWKDDYQQFLVEVNNQIKIILSDYRQMVKEILEWMKAGRHHEKSNPALGLLNHEGLGEGEINPATEISGGSVGDADFKLALLRKLAIQHGIQNIDSD